MGTNYIPTKRTVADIARELVRLHLRQELLGPEHRRTAGFVCATLRGRERSSALGEVHQVEVALDHLADKGLVSRTHEEWEVTERKPQLYRISKLATRAALERFCDERRRCQGPGCANLVTGVYCSETCAGRHANGVADVSDLPVSVPDKRAHATKRRVVG